MLIFINMNSSQKKCNNLGSGDPNLQHHQHSTLPPPPSPLALAQSTLPLPKSPCTPRSMGHAIRHRFKQTMRPGKCDLCEEYMFKGKYSVSSHNNVTPISYNILSCRAKVHRVQVQVPQGLRTQGGILACNQDLLLFIARCLLLALGKERGRE